MTHRLYYDAPYQTSFTAQVLACRPNGSAFDVLLDQTAFYPTSGGQPFDTGTLGSARVTDVNVQGDDVWHTVTEALAPGQTVQGQIDWPRRFDHMQQHAADHMIASALHRLMGGVTIGLHISADVSTIDVAMPEGKTRITPEDIRRIEQDVNERIWQDVPIRCWFPGPEELAALPLRKPPTVEEHVRIVAIGSDEMVACGGTHPATAGQLGLVRILSVTPARGKMRVAFLAGQRALADYQRCHQAAHEAASLLSTGVAQLCGSVAALQEKLRQAEYALTQLRREQLLSRAEQMLAEAEPLPDGTRLIARFVEADAELLRDLASRLITAPGVIALLGADNGGQAAFVFGRSGDVRQDMGALLRDSARPLGGKGGGRPDFAQGGGPAGVLHAACQALRSMP
ncbi:MAG: hypothetical protein IJE07_12005 [Clostridia bacterium]|nr:hypothetical protein [Clostridia bacterium]